MTSTTKQIPSCWACGHREWSLKYPSLISSKLSSENFAVTDANYGKTGELHLCNHCGFLQCMDVEEVTSYYEQLEDEAYEESREGRSLQAKKLLDFVKNFSAQGRLLDVGAGSGILVEQALQMGYQVQGIEPSIWFAQQAKNRNLPVVRGVIPCEQIKGPYDVITFIDVIEHVQEPQEILKAIRELMHPNSFLVVVTPDVSSILAKVLGRKWWHFRIAHIGYFNARNLNHLMNRSGFKLHKMSRPCWYFNLGYLHQRINQYLPKFLHFELPKSLQEIIVPLNLFDSLLGIYQIK